MAGVLYAYRFIMCYLYLNNIRSMSHKLLDAQYDQLVILDAQFNSWSFVYILIWGLGAPILRISCAKPYS